MSIFSQLKSFFEAWNRGTSKTCHRPSGSKKTTWSLRFRLCRSAALRTCVALKRRAEHSEIGAVLQRAKSNSLGFMTRSTDSTSTEPEHTTQKKQTCPDDREPRLVPSRPGFAAVGLDRNVPVDKDGSNVSKSVWASLLTSESVDDAVFAAM